MDCKVKNVKKTTIFDNILWKDRVTFGELWVSWNYFTNKNKKFHQNKIMQFGK